MGPSCWLYGEEERRVTRSHDVPQDFPHLLLQRPFHLQPVTSPAPSPALLHCVRWPSLFVSVLTRSLTCLSALSLCCLSLW